jgi:ATP-dependent Clp protease adaptor protein ClpS
MFGSDGGSQISADSKRFYSPACFILNKKASKSFPLRSYFRIFLTMTTATPQAEEEVLEEIRTQEPAKVILFNDEIHTFDEVIAQLIKAIKCVASHAEALANEVHTKGRACVFGGELPKCLEVSAVLEEIHLMTHIEM